MATGDRVDPISSFRFTVESDGIQKAGFSEVSGFDVSIDVIEYREGNEVETPRKLKGLTKYSNITLKAGVVDSPDMFEWMKSAMEGAVERYTLTLKANDEDGNPVATWTIQNCWPIKYSAPDFNATSSAVAVESLEIAHEGLVRED